MSNPLPASLLERTSLITSGQHPEVLSKVKQINQVFQQFSLPGAPERTELVATHRISVLANQQDFECCLLGGLGFSSEVIHRRTGLSIGQIQTRLRKAGISRMNYRNGKSAFALAVVEGVGRKAANLVQAQYRYLEAAAERGA